MIAYETGFFFKNMYEVEILLNKIEPWVQTPVQLKTCENGQCQLHQQE
jgi:hypothetical protein